MASRRPRTCLVPVLLALLAGCDEEGGCNQCDECQSAIDHVREKIESFGCDPTPMDKARQRINDECDENPALIIGAIVEACNSVPHGGSLFVQAPCKNAIIVDIPVTFIYDPAAEGLPEEVKLAVYSGGSHKVDVTLRHGESQTHLMESMFDQADVRIDWWFTGEDPIEYFEATGSFQIDTTTDNWTNYNTRQIVVTESDGTPFIDFPNWRSDE